MTVRFAVKFWSQSWNIQVVISLIISILIISVLIIIWKRVQLDAVMNGVAFVFPRKSLCSGFCTTLSDPFSDDLVNDITVYSTQGRFKLSIAITIASWTWFFDGRNYIIQQPFKLPRSISNIGNISIPIDTQSFRTFQSLDVIFRTKFKESRLNMRRLSVFPLLTLWPSKSSILNDTWHVYISTIICYLRSIFRIFARSVTVYSQYKSFFLELVVFSYFSHLLSY